MHTTLLNSATTVNEAVRICPESITLFKDAGIDTCCGGSLSIADAAQLHGLNSAQLVATVQELMASQCVFTPRAGSL